MGKWVQFEENSDPPQSTNKEVQDTAGARYNGAVIDTESVQVDIDKVKQIAQSTTNQEGQNQTGTSSRNLNSTLRTISLDEAYSSGLTPTPIDTCLQRRFANGDVIVSVLPVNQKWPWIIPANFMPELVPEELMAEGLSLAVEDYVQIMETLVHDVRFTAYNVCYKRLLMAWLLVSFIILLGLLFSGARGPTLFGCGVLWLVVTAAAIFVVMWIKSKLNHGLEKCVAKANQLLIRHNIILGVDDRGKLSCQKTHLCFIYFDTSDCVKKLQSIIKAEENVSQAEANPEEQRRRTEFHSRMDIDDSDIVVTGANTTRISRKQEKARMLLLRYSQRWAKALSRNSLDLQLYAAQIAALATETGPKPPALFS